MSMKCRVRYLFCDFLLAIVRSVIFLSGKSYRDYICLCIYYIIKDNPQIKTNRLKIEYEHIKQVINLDANDGLEDMVSFDIPSQLKKRWL